jgi:thioredoxin:protein disulfide reductase
MQLMKVTIILSALLMSVSVFLHAGPRSAGLSGNLSLPAPQSAPNITVSGKLANDKVKRGGSTRGTVTMEIPSGYHVNSNRPLEKFLVATQLQLETPNGLRVGPIAYPRAVLRTFTFSKVKVSVYEGRPVMSFTVSVPAGAPTGQVELKGRLRYQSCSDSLCFPPRTLEVKLYLTVN